MCRGACDAALLRGEWKALWRDSDTVPGTVAGVGCTGLFDRKQ